MQSYFTVETIKIIGPCQEAIENIRKYRAGRKTQVLEKLAARLSAKFWLNHPWRHFVLKQKPSYDLAKIMSCEKARREFFSEVEMFAAMEYNFACGAGKNAEEVCEKLLAAGKMCRDITLTVDDWMTVSQWAKP